MAAAVASKNALMVANVSIDSVAIRWWACRQLAALLVALARASLSAPTAGAPKSSRRSTPAYRRPAPPDPALGGLDRRCQPIPEELILLEHDHV